MGSGVGAGRRTLSPPEEQQGARIISPDSDIPVAFIAGFSDIIVMKEIAFTAAAAKQLDALPVAAADAITEALCDLALTGRGNVKKLKGQDGYRLRVGNYRVIYEADAMTILAIYIGRRTSTTY